MEKTQLAIIGSGPAGYTAAIYSARAKIQTTLLTGLESGGQLMYTTDIENFPGFSQGIAGPKLMMEMRSQAERFGAKIVDIQATKVDFSSLPFKIWTSDSPQSQPDIEAQSVIIATGATSIRLHVPGEDKFFGHGVSTCAVCDAPFYKDKETFVIGGGDSAMEDALALSKHASSVTIVHRRDSFKASKIMQERVLGNDKIKVLWNSTLKEILGEDLLAAVKIETEGEVKEYSTDGVFFAIGHKPATQLFENQIELDEKKYVITGQSLSKAGLKKAENRINQENLVEFPTMTSVDGVFAGGDVVDLRFKQAITAAGQGCAAALDAEKWLEKNENTK